MLKLFERDFLFLVQLNLVKDELVLNSLESEGHLTVAHIQEIPQFRALFNSETRVVSRRMDHLNWDIIKLFLPERSPFR